MNLSRLAMIAVMSCATFAFAQRPPTMAAPDNTPPPGLQGIGIDQNLDAQLPMDLVFRDEDGNSIRLGDCFQGRPAVLALVYYECPMLCTVVLNDLLRGFVANPLVMGKDYDVITVSFNPRETAKLASDKKRHYVRTYAAGERAKHEASARQGWRFLTGDADSIRRLTQTVGFRYKYDEASQEYLHPSGITILTPDGRIARYFFGIDYDPKDLRLSLVEASDGKIGTLTDHVMLYCFKYDATKGKYGLAVMRAVRVGGAVTIFGLLGGVTWMLWRERAARRMRNL